jgi:hypothetical protein
MYSEQLAIMLFMAVTQVTHPQIKQAPGPVLEDARQAVIRSVREPELVAALSLRAKRIELRKQRTSAEYTLLASSD